MHDNRKLDYSLVGEDSKLAIERGLAEADWYQSPISRKDLRELLKRKDGPATRDTLIWISLLAVSAYFCWMTWGTGWAFLAFAIYGVLYASVSDSRWHESSHGTAFKTDWMNNLLYEVASFMVLRESIPWRWSHTRHHSDTIIVGRDPEIAVPRPPNILTLILNFFHIPIYKGYIKNVFTHAFGIVTPEEKTYLPESEYKKVILRARIYLLIYASVAVSALMMKSILPLLFVGLPHIYGGWLLIVYGLTQHAGLAENVLDHRLNCRTIYMNRINRFLYWNMNYHTEHHMFPLVPYHALPQLHEKIKADLPKPYSGLVEAYQEIIPAIWRQRKDPGYFVKRTLPTPTDRTQAPNPCISFQSARGVSTEGWISVCREDQLTFEEVVRFDHDQKTYAIYQTGDGNYYATDGICTHGNTHLAEGLIKGKLIECPKHNGRFNVVDGAPARPPVCVALKTYPVRKESGWIQINLISTVPQEKTYSFKVVANENVATFIKELVLELEDPQQKLKYQPGDYMQLDIPAYGEMAFDQIPVSEPFASVWKTHHVFDNKAKNDTKSRRNYSLATNPQKDHQFRFNVRIATPPRGQACLAGSGSTYIHSLKPGDRVTAVGPFGDFRIKNTEKEMIYLGGGAGMAPLRSHISYLLETLKSGRKISYWYGARSLQEVFYEDYFRNLEKSYLNFTFHLALSESPEEEKWAGPKGFVHEVLRENYLKNHPDPKAVEYYLCGPPLMMKAAKKMLQEFEVDMSQVAYDEF